MTVQNKKTNRVAEVISQDEKLVRVRYIKEGEEQNMTVSTFKRWWKKIDDELDEQTKKAIEVVKEMPTEKVVETVEKVIKKEKAKKAIKQLVEDDKCGDGTPLAEVGKEILEQAKQKAKQAKKKQQNKPTVKKEDKRSDKLSDCLDAIKDSLSEARWHLDSYDKNNRYSYIKKDGVERGSNVYFYIGNKTITVGVKNKMMPTNLKPDRTRKCLYANIFDIGYTKKDLQRMVSILKKLSI